MVRITCADGAVGVGYTYTIGTGGSSVVALLRDHLAPRLVGRDASEIEAIWKDLFFAHARHRRRRHHEPRARGDRHRAVGPEVRAAPASRCGRLAGGAQRRVPVYTTEGGWLHHPAEQLVDESVAAKAQGFRGAKMKVGKPSIAEDVARLAAVREAVGDDFELMVDANQAFTVAEALPPRACLSRPLARAGSRSRCRPRTWRATSSSRPRRRCRSRSANRCTTRRTSASTSSAARARSFKSTARASAASRRGSRSRTWPRLSMSPVCPHFLMELHVSLSAAVPNGAWVEYIPAARRRHHFAHGDGRRLRDSTVDSRPRHRLGLGRRIDRHAVARATVSLKRPGTHADPKLAHHPPASERRRRHRARAARRRHDAARRERSRSSGLVPPGHKVATRAIKRRRAGAALQPDHRLREPRHRAGRARAPAQPRDGHVRARLRVRRRRASRPQFAPTRRRRSMGIVRADGRVATRNYIGILSTVNCSATVARGIADHFTRERLAAFPNVDGVVALTHGSGCGMDTQGEGMQLLRRTLGGYARHAELRRRADDRPRLRGATRSARCSARRTLEEGPLLRTFSIQDTGGTAKTDRARHRARSRRCCRSRTR